MLGKDLLVKILNCSFDLKLVAIFESFCQNEKFLNLNIHTNFKSKTIAFKLFVNPQLLILLFWATEKLRYFREIEKPTN